ncbi:MAG: FkbM family methyltransferase [Undibacterium sp.]|nr:FkbM family methyltransferase [Opitutaceae bacterium]
MRKILRSLLHRAGYDLIHRSDDSVLVELRALQDILRLAPQDYLRWSDSLAIPASHACLRHLLRIKQIDLLIDVGANRGQFARLARQVGYTGEIASVEPLSRYHPDLRAAAAADGRWRIFPMAAGSENTARDLNVAANDVFSSLYPISEAGRARFGAQMAVGSVERVQVRTLDSLWPEISGGTPRRVLLKTDTQGHDLEVLGGATQVLGSTHALMTEASIQNIYAGTPRFFEVATWLESRGFALSGVFPMSHRAEDLALIEVDAFFTRPLSAAASPVPTV